MSALRGQVMTELLTRLNNVVFSAPVNGASTWITGPGTTVPNKLRLWADVSSDQQPACFLVTHRESDDYRGLGLLRRRLELGVWCYSRADNTPGLPDLDVILEAILGILAPDSSSTNECTLGKLVYYARIEGKVFKDPGDIDNQTLLIVPIVVEMP